MRARITLFSIILFFAASPSYCEFPVLETDNIMLSMGAYLRNDVVSFKNTVDLDSSNSDDSTTYLGIDYNLGFRSELKESGQEFYLKLERNGPTDYNAPLFAHNTLMTSGGVIEEYHNDELLPQVEEFWLDTPLWGNLRFKSGLYAYEVGNGFALNGGYENYAATLYQEYKNTAWRLYYCRPDLVYKNHLGPRIRQDEEQGIDYNHNSANFFAADVKLEGEKNSLQAYAGVLSDYTSPAKRDNIFSTPIKKDLLGTFGVAANFALQKAIFKVEAARNFGKAESSDSAYKDIYHRGYLVYTGLEYDLGKITPSFNFLLCSGNKVTPEMAVNQDATLTSAKNRAFSYYSPLNKNLGESISGCHTDIRPVVAMGTGCGLNYGVSRPETFSATDFDNLVMPVLGVGFKITEKLKIDLDGYYLMSFEKGAGTLGGEGRYLSRELGSELDLYLEYRMDKNTIISFLGGYFFPGRYYRQERDDTPGSLLTSFIRGIKMRIRLFRLSYPLSLNSNQKGKDRDDYHRGFKKNRVKNRPGKGSQRTP